MFLLLVFKSERNPLYKCLLYLLAKQNYILINRFCCNKSKRIIILWFAPLNGGAKGVHSMDTLSFFYNIALPTGKAIALEVARANTIFDRFLHRESDQTNTKKLLFQPKIFFARELVTKNNLRRIGNACHARHYAEHVVRVGINTDLSSGNTGNSVGRKDKLEGGIVDSGEVARA